MCGVIGYVGRRHAKERLLKGLERLEYRGYDSAGICLMETGGLEAVRSVGKLENLKTKLDGRAHGATTGIGHTRWATHGRVTEANAHPLRAGDHEDVMVVLNGIIENFAEIKAELIADGETFASETDAEVVAHLVRSAYAGDLLAAVQAIVGRLEGHFAFVATHVDHADELVGTRRQCPLLVGVGDGETFLASSITAFSTDTRRIKVIEDDEIVLITAAGARLFAADGTELERDEVLVAWDDEVAEKRGYESFMLKEIHEQPDAVGTTISRNLDRGALAMRELDAIDLTDVRRLLIIGCGTALNAGMVGAFAIEEWAELPVDVEVASEWRYRNPRLEPGTLVLGVSQSGETADTIAALRLARERGAATIAITNMAGSQITREVDAVLHTHAGLEMGVAATKTFSAQIALLYLLGLRMAQARATLIPEQIDALLTEVRALPHKILAALQQPGDVDEIAFKHYEKPYFLYLGRHIGLPVCLEGALKLKEISYIPTEAYAAGEMKHGPIALLDENTPVVCVATQSHVTDKLLSNLQETSARGAQIVAIATEGDEAVRDVADDVIYVPRTHPLLQPAVAVLPLQLLAYRIASLRGLDVDQPRNLAKTVTVE